MIYPPSQATRVEVVAAVEQLRQGRHQDALDRVEAILCRGDGPGVLLDLLALLTALTEQDDSAYSFMLAALALDGDHLVDD